MGGGGCNAMRYHILDPLKSNIISDRPPQKKKSNIRYHAFEKIRYLALKNHIDIRPQKRSIIRYQGAPVQHPPPPPHISIPVEGEIGILRQGYIGHWRIQQFM